MIDTGDLALRNQTYALLVELGRPPLAAEVGPADEVRAAWRRLHDAHALVLNGDWAEIKRMWVEQDARGRGLSRRILETLIETARAAGVPIVRLETGAVSHEALGLYESAGFRRRGPFAAYPPDPLSVFMEKHL